MKCFNAEACQHEVLWQCLTMCWWLTVWTLNFLSSPPPQPYVFFEMKGHWTRCTHNHSKTVLVPKQVTGLPCTTHYAANRRRVRFLKLKEVFRREERCRRDRSCFIFISLLLVYEKSLLPFLHLPLQMKDSEPFLFLSQLLEVRRG